MFHFADWGRWLTQLGKQLRRGGQRRPPRGRSRRPQASRLYLESLEDRNTPSIIMGADYGGANLLPQNGDVLEGTFTHVGTFLVAPNTTVYVEPGTPLSVSANAIRIDGTLDGDGAGYAGGAHGLNGSPGS